MNIRTSEQVQDNINTMFTVKKLIAAAMFNPEFSSYVIDKFYIYLEKYCNIDNAIMKSYSSDGFTWNISISIPKKDNYSTCSHIIVVNAMRELFADIFSNQLCLNLLYMTNPNWYNELDKLLHTTDTQIKANYILYVVNMFPVMVFNYPSDVVTYMRVQFG